MKKVISIAALSATVALAGCSEFSIASKGWTQIKGLGDTVTAQCDFEKNTVKIDGNIVHLEAEAKPIKYKGASISCDLPTKTLIIKYAK